MKKLKPAKRLGVGVMLIALTGGLAAASLTTAASADPFSASARNGVGGDGLQDVFDAFAGGAPTPPSPLLQYYTPLHSSAATGNATIQSFDSYPYGGSIAAPGAITTKAGGPSFDRPSSSGNGVAALNASAGFAATFKNPANSATGVGVNITGQVDFSRSASGPKTGGTNLVFVPFARDSSAVVYWDHGQNNPSITSLTAAQLNSLYTNSGGAITIGTQTLIACLPLTGSAVRTNFLTAIGITSASDIAAAATAANAHNCNDIDQNSANVFYSRVSALPANTDAVFPFATASWIAQLNGVAEDRSDVGRANGVKSVSVDTYGKPEQGTAPNLTASSVYNNSPYGNTVYTVVARASIIGGFKDTGLADLFAGPSSAICAAAAQATVTKFGYDHLDTGAGEPACGVTTIQGNS